MTSPPITIRNDNQELFGDAFRRTCLDIPGRLALMAATEEQGSSAALLVSRFLPVSVEPAMLAVSLKGNCLGSAPLHRIKRFSLNLLQEDQDHVLRRIYAERSDPLQEFAWYSTDFGVPVLENVIALLCTTSSITETGDHQLVIGEVKELIVENVNPLLTWRNGLYRLALNFPHLENDDSLEQFIHDWETGTLDRSRWNHAAHITIISYYVFDHEREKAYALMKSGIFHYNLCVGIENTEDGGYHETLTRFWAEILGSFVRSGQFTSRLAAVRESVRVFGHDREHYRLYYSYDLKRDRRARQEWVAPDRKPTPVQF